MDPDRVADVLNAAVASGDTALLDRMIRAGALGARLGAFANVYSLTVCLCLLDLFSRMRLKTVHPCTHVYTCLSLSIPLKLHIPAPVQLRTLISSLSRLAIPPLAPLMHSAALGMSFLVLQHCACLS